MQVEIIPCLRDNYAYLIHDPRSKTMVVIDPSEAAPVLRALRDHQWELTYICNTHHHSDHVGGNLELKEKTGAKVVGFRGDQHRLLGLDIPVDEDQVIQLGTLEVKILFIPGHTLGHISYYFPESGTIFVGDTLFSLGCGRLFEGTAEQMWQSLKLLYELPAETVVYCGHEYTLDNALFALTLEDQNADLLKYIEECKRLRSHNKPTLPTTIEIERQLNPFLRADGVDAFRTLREQKDNFKRD